MSEVRIRALISGRVQGVWFRESTRQRATALGLRGWVRNRADGGVEAEFEGRREDVEAALEFVRTGPPLARVKGIEIHEQPARHEEAGFRVRRGE